MSLVNRAPARLAQFCEFEVVVLSGRLPVYRPWPAVRLVAACININW